MDLSSPQEYFAVHVIGDNFAGKSTFIKAACDGVKSVILRQHGSSYLGDVFYGLHKADDEHNLILYNFPSNSWRPTELPGTWLGVIAVVNTHKPEEIYYRIRDRVGFYRTYTNLPVIVVANPHARDPETREYKYSGDSDQRSIEELRSELQLDEDILLVKCDASDPVATKAVLAQLIQSKVAQKPFEDFPPLPPVFSEKDLFVPDRTHRFLVVVGTERWYSANYFVDLLVEQDRWVALESDHTLRRWSHIEISSTFDLHLIPVEHFGSPKNGVSVAVQSILAMVEGQPPPEPEIEGELLLTEGTIACIGLFNSQDKLSVACAKHMVKAFGDYPYLLIDMGRGNVGQPTDEAYLGSRNPIIRFGSRDKQFPQQALCLLSRQFSGAEGEKLRSKFDCL